MSRLEYFFHLNPQLFLTFRLKISEKNLHMKQIETFYKCVFFMSKLYGKYLKNWRRDIDLFWTAQWLSNVDLFTGENLVGKARLRKRVLQMLLTGVSRSTGGRRVRSLVYVKFSIISRDVYVLIIFRRCLNL